MCQKSAFLIFFIFYTISQTFAQNIPQDTLSSTPVIAVSLSNISSVSEKDQIWLDQIVSRYTSSNQTDLFQQEYSSLNEEIISSNDGISSSIFNKLPYRKIENLSREWQRYNNTLNELVSRINIFSNQLIADMDRTGSIKQKWTLTLKNLRKNSNTPTTLITRVNALLKQIDKAENLLTDKFNLVLKIQDQTSQTVFRLTQNIQMVQTELETRNEEMLIRDTPPIWNTTRFHWSRLSIKTLIINSLDELKSATRIFINEYARAFLVHLLFTLLLWGLMFTAKKELEKDHMQKRNGSALLRKLLTPSINATLIISLSLVNVFYPNAPLFIYEIASIIILIPLIYEFSELVSKELFKVSLIFAALYLAETSHNILLTYTDLNWVSGLIVSCLAFVVFIRYVQSKSFLGDKQNNQLLQYTRILIKFFTVLLGASIIANLLGFYRLSNKLNISTIESVYLAILFYTISKIIHALLFTLVYSRFGQMHSSILRLHADRIMKRLPKYINIAMVIFWGITSMTFYNVYDPVKEAVLSFLSTSHKVGSINVSLGNVLVFFIIAYLTAWLVKVLRFVLEHEVMPRYTMPRGMPTAISLMIRISLYSIGFLMALAATGIELENISILLGALGVGIGFGLQNIFNNLVSGLILAFERPIQQGDVVQLGDLLGHVKEIGFRSSRIRTFEGSEVIVPNGNLISNELINWTLSDRQKRLEVIVGVAYGTDPHRVIDIITKESVLHPDVLAMPKPIGLFTGFGDSSLDFRLLFWTSDFEDWLRIKSEVALLVHDAITREGIEIPFPQRDLHIRSVQIPHIPVEVENKKNTDLPNKKEDN